MKYIVKIFNNSHTMEDWLNSNEFDIVDFKIAMTDNYLMVVATIKM